MKFGFSFLAQQLDGYTPLAGFNGAGTFTYKGVEPVAGGNNSFATAAEAPCYSGTGATTGSGSGNNYDPSCGTLVNFLTNNPQTATRPFASQAPDVVNKHYLRDKIYSGYVQDDWRIRHSLTLNLGLRYEMSTIPDGDTWRNRDYADALYAAPVRTSNAGHMPSAQFSRLCVACRDRPDYHLKELLLDA